LDLFAVDGFDAIVSHSAMRNMWEKWIGLATAPA
jgi:hypothetical protein